MMLNIVIPPDVMGSPDFWEFLAKQEPRTGDPGVRHQTVMGGDVRRRNAHPGRPEDVEGKNEASASRCARGARWHRASDARRTDATAATAIINIDRGPRLVTTEPAKEG